MSKIIKIMLVYRLKNKHTKYKKISIKMTIMKSFLLVINMINMQLPTQCKL